MKIDIVPLNKAGFPPDIGGAIMDSLALTQSRARRIAEKIALRLQMRSPARSGMMRSSVVFRDLRTYGRGSFSFWVGFSRASFSGKFYYPRTVCYGSGIFGLYGVPIRSRIAPHLAWQYQGRWVSAKEVKGQRPQRLLEDIQRFGRREIKKEFERSMVRTFRTKFR